MHVNRISFNRSGPGSRHNVFFVFGNVVEQDGLECVQDLKALDLGLPLVRRVHDLLVEVGSRFLRYGVGHVVD